MIKDKDIDADHDNDNARKIGKCPLLTKMDLDLTIHKLLNNRKTPSNLKFESGNCQNFIFDMELFVNFQKLLFTSYVTSKQIFMFRRLNYQASY